MQTSLSELVFTHLNLDARDLDASARFYGEFLGLPLIRRDGTLRVEHPAYLLVINAGEPKIGGSFHFGFRVGGPSDVDAWTDRLRRRGVPIVIEPRNAGSVYVVRVADPDRYEIEIYAELAAGTEC